jgi:hypothetical protein
LRAKGLEPPRLKTPDPKSGASASSATLAMVNVSFNTALGVKIFSDFFYFRIQTRKILAEQEQVVKQVNFRQEYSESISRFDEMLQVKSFSFCFL